MLGRLNPEAPHDVVLVLDATNGQNALAQIDARGLSPALSAVAELIGAELALRSLRVNEARASLTRAQAAAERSGVPALQAEVAHTLASLAQPAARRHLRVGLLMALVGICAVKIWRTAADSPVAAHEEADAPAIGWKRKLYWIVLAAVPSGLMLSTTSHLTTDLMAMPLLWVIPLGLYLLSFSIACRVRLADSISSPSGTSLRLLARSCSRVAAWSMREGTLGMLGRSISPGLNT